MMLIERENVVGEGVLDGLQDQVGVLAVEEGRGVEAAVRGAHEGLMGGGLQKGGLVVKEGLGGGGGGELKGLEVGRGEEGV